PLRRLFARGVRRRCGSVAHRARADAPHNDRGPGEVGHLMVETTAYTIKALDETTWDAFAALVERNNGVFGGCWCMGFHPEGGDKSTTPALNRQHKLERVREGKAHAALVFDGEECVGWCQFGA